MHTCGSGTKPDSIESVADIAERIQQEYLSVLLWRTTMLRCLIGMRKIAPRGLTESVSPRKPK
jgi:hypothetical protein